MQVNKLETAVEGSGDRRRVRITGLDLDIRDELHKQHLWWADGCFHTDQRINDDDEPYAKSGLVQPGPAPTGRRHRAAGQPGGFAGGVRRRLPICRRSR